MKISSSFFHRLQQPFFSKNHLLLLKRVSLIVSILSSPTLLMAEITWLAPGYSGSSFYTHPTTDNIISYDWASGQEDLYYLTGTPFFTVGGVFRYGETLQSLYTSNHFVGSSLVTIGNSIYFNDSSLNGQFLYQYDTVTQPASVGPAISSALNFGLYDRPGTHELWITGSAQFETSEIFYSPLTRQGTLLNDPPVALGISIGSSGPLHFDTSGNLYYAPGFNNRSIYRWSTEEITTALADPLGAPLTSEGHLWVDYSGLFPTVSGGTSILIDPEGHLLISLSDFVNPSQLARFGVDSTTGAFDGSVLRILEDDGRVGELREHEGKLFFSSDNTIYQLVPEPSTSSLLWLAFAWIGIRRRKHLFLSNSRSSLHK